jgi:hypothetical protein
MTRKLKSKDCRKKEEMGGGEAVSTDIKLKTVEEESEEDQEEKSKLLFHQIMTLHKLFHSFSTCEQHK